MRTTPNSVWKVSDSARSTYTQDGAVILDIQKGLCYSLNVVAAKAWSALESHQGGSTFQDLIDSLRKQFDAPRERLEADIAEHLEKLEKAGLVHRSAFQRPPPPS